LNTTIFGLRLPVVNVVRLLVLSGAVCASTPVAAQTPQPSPPATREEQIAAERTEKRATLWPEQESPLVGKANRLANRGFLQGVQSGEGNNGWQVLLSGTRTNQGQTFGVGYRRSDLFHDALSVRSTVRGTVSGAFMVDGKAHLNRLRRSDETFIELYGKYERSPRMEFYGTGAATSEADRTGYLLNTGEVELQAGYRFTRRFNAGFTVGYGGAHTGSVDRDDVPSIETKFDAGTAPGLFDDARFIFYGGFAGFDTRDAPRGPKRGGFYGIEMQRFHDPDGGVYTHSQLELSGQQFLPYFNATRVLALLVRARFAFTDGPDQVVPFYMVPSLGGSFDLRGFAPYRFQDNDALAATVEHRWHIFSLLEMALFADAGTTVAEKGRIAWENLRYDGGLGLRVRLMDAVLLRTDVAKSREGWRWIWSLSDVSRRRF